jgi:hypothetical protein
MLKAIALFFLVGTTVSYARLGETQQECEKRYGPVVERLKSRLPESDKESLVFSKEGVTIIAETHNGTVWSITYSMKDLTQQTADVFLDVNAPKEGWGKPLSIKGEEIRTTPARNQFSAYLPSDAKAKRAGRITICSRAFSKANRVDYDARLLSIREKLKEREASATLKGF